VTGRLTLVPTTARPDLDDEARRVFAGHWPEFIFHDAGVKRVMERAERYFADWNFFVLDEDAADGALVGACYGVPLRWDRTVDDLPGGYTDSLTRSVLEHEAGTPPDTLVVMGAMVHNQQTGRGLAGRILTGLRQEATARGMAAVIAPVRPTLKSKYPVTPIEEFMAWQRPDGLPLDPWLRTHARLGARIVAAAPASQTMTGTVAEWESWVDLRLPSSGDYVIPDGLALLHVDHAADTGTYHEPNVWMRHL
jgi:hypothetical protein